MKKFSIHLDTSLEIPVYVQIKKNIEQGIREGQLKTGFKLPSIHKMASGFNLAPGTVIRAYNELRGLGIISSKQGKGYYVSDNDVFLHQRIFLLFDRINAFKEVLYDSFRNEFDDKTDIQVFFHHYELKRFERLIRENVGKFTHYVLMPHLNENIPKITDRLPENSVIFIDSLPENLKTNAMAVYQDFYNDIFKTLESVTERLKRYKNIYLSLSQSHFQFVPLGIQKGFRDFCRIHSLAHAIVGNISASNFRKNNLYIIFDDRELLNTLKIIRKNGWKLKRDIGIISFDETPMKELLAGGISVLSTDFVKMGKTAAALVKGNLSGQIANPFFLIERKSF